MRFEQHDVPAESRTRRLRLDLERSADLPAWVFSTEELAFDVAVLPLTTLSQACSPASMAC